MVRAKNGKFVYDMKISVAQNAINICDGSQSELAKRLVKITGHKYTQSNVNYWKRTGYFPADVAHVVASQIFDGEITAHEACPKFKKQVA